MRGIRIEVCPYDTVSGVQISRTRARHGNLIHEKERLGVAPYTVLPPPEIEDKAKSAGERDDSSATGASAGRRGR